MSRCIWRWCMVTCSATAMCSTSRSLLTQPTQSSSGAVPNSLTERTQCGRTHTHTHTFMLMQTDSRQRAQPGPFSVHSCARRVAGFLNTGWKRIKRRKRIEGIGIEAGGQQGRADFAHGKATPAARAPGQCAPLLFYSALFCSVLLCCCWVFVDECR